MQSKPLASYSNQRVAAAHLVTNKAKKPNKVGGSSKRPVITAEGMREDAGRTMVP